MNSIVKATHISQLEGPKWDDFQKICEASETKCVVFSVKTVVFEKARPEHRKTQGFWKTTFLYLKYPHLL